MANDTRDLIAPICDAQVCNGHGHCFVMKDNIGCHCRLGYNGEFCQHWVSEPIGVPLTLGFLGCIIGLVALAFLFAFIKKRVKAHKRKTVPAHLETMVMTK